MKRIRVSAAVEEAKLIHRVSPDYPPEARAAGISGTVRFRALTATDGSVKQVDVMSGDPALVPAARAAVLQWTYKPTLLNGEPIEVETWIDVSFSLLEPFTPGAGGTPPSTKPGPGTTTIGGSPGQPVLILRIVPSCWPEAKEVNDSGTVELHVVISPDGTVKDVQVASGHPVLAEAAVKAMRKWKFRPELRDGNPVAAETFVTFVFSGLHSVDTPGFSIPESTGDKKLFVTPAKEVRSVPPVYPKKARKQGIQGSVRVFGYVSKEGLPVRLEVLSGDPMLAPAALDAIRQWRYQPMLVNGEPVEVENCVEVRFKLGPN